MHLGISYCGIALRYIGEYSQLFTFIIGCFPYNAASHSAKHLREFVNKILEEYKLQLDSTKFVVTDNEPKMLPAYREQCSRVGCADHYLNKQHSHQQQKLSQQLQTYSETRFDGTIIMLDIFREEILGALSEDQQPSLHRVIPLRQYLMNKCEVKEEDSAAIIRLEVFLGKKKIMLNISQAACRIKNAWHITDHHRLSTILHPKLKNLDCCIDEKEKSINVILPA
ncbi:unnamed protein product [Rotaria sordida]|uniref:MULE transposase domain-containing protein n=1 Tax=Rotaria sordida TaxID=392033 RepID=A0A819NHD4_9BILA|nr:unnamed protein product [Rotaria sordida]CAF4053292.1 unnamed protein product [Rotaria sordida]